jgi:ABC-2 type transport system permease protein
MNRLLRVELTRLLWRRAVLVILVVAVAIPTVIGVARVLNTQPPSDADLAYAEEQVAAERDLPGVQRRYQRCLDDPERFLGQPLPDDVEAACDQNYLPQPEWYVYWEQLNLVDDRDNGSGLAVVIVLAILMMLAGTTFAGHDWASGSVSNQLLFEPRRPLVWAAKGAIVTGVAGLFSAVVVTAYWLFLGVVANSRDIPTGDGLLLDCLQSGWRGAAVAAGAALAGYALTMLFRSTVAALGVLLAASVAGGIVLAVIGVDSVWNPGLNIAAIILDGAEYYAEGPCPGGTGFAGEVCSVEKTLPLGRALWFLGTGLVLFAAASLASFQRRDVP